MANGKCEYPGCDELVNAPHDNAHCVFHAPADKKGCSVSHFNAQIFSRIRLKSLNFRGYIFPGAIDFNKAEIYNQYERRSEFSNYVDFSNSKFISDSPDQNSNSFISFREIYFLNTVNFSGIVFDLPVDFTSAIFEDESDFSDTIFRNTVHLEGASFKKVIDFNNVKFNNSIFNETSFANIVNFDNAEFNKYVIFYKTKFLNEGCFFRSRFLQGAEFERCIFAGDILFDNIFVCGNINISQIEFGERSSFLLESPVFENKSATDSNDSRQQGVYKITFTNMKFPPFSTQFNSIWPDVSNESPYWLYSPILIFRLCELRDIYITDCDLSLFSFYKSTFDEIKLISNQWGFAKDRILIFKYNRKNILPEDRILAQFERIPKYWKLGYNDIYFEVTDLKGFSEVATLYRRMKSALDHSKDFQEASWFYFNEMEMKRKAAIENIKEVRLRFKVLNKKLPLLLYQNIRRVFSKQSIYWFYKVFAGYGEKPLWSFYWFWIFTLLFSLLHLLNGLVYTGDGEGFSYSFKSISGIRGPVTALLYTLSRIIPVSYLRQEPLQFTADGLTGSFLAISNTFVLLIFLVFIGVGLKRHFRRF